MTEPVITSAPGKILWLGGYAILEKGNIGVVTSIDKRVYARASELPAGEVEMIASQLKLSATGKYENGKIALTKQSDSSKFVKTAIETTLAYLESIFKKPKGVKLETYSDPAFHVTGGKSGLGSSAAVTVATVAAVLVLNGMDLQKERETIHKIAQISHSVAQGKVGSGFDIAASTYGCIEYTRYNPELLKETNIGKLVGQKWDYIITPFNLPKEFITVSANFPNMSANTSEMVALVKNYKEKNPEQYAELITQVNNFNTKAVLTLGKINGKLTPSIIEEFVSNFEGSRRLLKELGRRSNAPIETDDMSKLIEDTKKYGALVAMLPGAGGGDSISAICTSEHDAEQVRKFWKDKKLEILEVNASSTGVCMEKLFPLDIKSINNYLI